MVQLQVIKMDQAEKNFPMNIDSLLSALFSHETVTVLVLKRVIQQLYTVYSTHCFQSEFQFEPFPIITEFGHSFSTIKIHPSSTTAHPTATVDKGDPSFVIIVDN